MNTNPEAQRAASQAGHGEAGPGPGPAEPVWELALLDPNPAVACSSCWGAPVFPSGLRGSPATPGQGGGWILQFQGSGSCVQHEVTPGGPPAHGPLKNGCPGGLRPIGGSLALLCVPTVLQRQLQGALGKLRHGQGAHGREEGLTILCAGAPQVPQAVLGSGPVHPAWAGIQTPLPPTWTSPAAPRTPQCQATETPA